MPIYEFYSPDTHRIYSFFARSLAQGRRVPLCPDDAQARMERMVSGFAVTGRTKESTNDNAEMDPRMEGTLAEMEREMASYDEHSPDPRHLGNIMRRMSAATGQKMPDAMRQMIERLERGEDPETLEKEFEGVFDDLDPQLTENAGALPHRTRHAAPGRDPKLYEMADFLPDE